VADILFHRKLLLGPLKQNTKNGSSSSTKTMAISTKLHRSNHYKILISYTLRVMCKRMKKVISTAFLNAELPLIP